VFVVGGAVWVGLRQAKISANQTEILSKQTELAAASLRSELFERRMTVYSAAVAFLEHIESPDSELHRKLTDDLLKYGRESQFLLGKNAFALIGEIYGKRSAYQTALVRMRRSYSIEETYDGEAQKVRDEAQREMHLLIQWRGECLATLNNVFAPDLTIEAHASSLTPSQ